MRDAIYCSGSLLAAVQNSRLYNDCKHFVDCPLKFDAETILTNWNILMGTVGRDGTIPVDVLRSFIEEHFEQPGGELEDCQPQDYNHEHTFDVISDEKYRLWAKDLHSKWPTLTRRVTDKVMSAPDRSSLLAVPKPFVVPGGRFRELYYWDAFFTIRGLLASGMYTTVRGMCENMGHLIENYGFVPNGNRIYYLNRSQPPLLTWCVAAYFEHTQDVEFLRHAMPWLEKEMEYFMKHKMINQPNWKSYLFRFHVVATGPRPESYREDMESAEHIQDEIEKNRLYGDIAAAAESGRDFSARWFSNEGPQAGKMGSTRTSTLIPVELNAIICSNFRYFAEFYTHLGDTSAAEKYRVQYEVMREAIHQVFWNEELGCWFDYDLVLGRQLPIFFDTNLFPLFAGCTHDNFEGRRVVEYLTNSGALAYPGGVPTSLITSGQQWDFPSGWAPTNWIIIQGLRASGEIEVARALAEKWTRKNYQIWRNSGGRMYEKYNVASECFKTMGGGGEYEVQEGFGWTNGVILDLLITYGELVSNQESNCACCQQRRASIVLATKPINLLAAQATLENNNISTTPMTMDPIMEPVVAAVAAATICPEVQHKHTPQVAAI